MLARKRGGPRQRKKIAPVDVQVVSFNNERTTSTINSLKVPGEAWARRLAEMQGGQDPLNALGEGGPTVFREGPNKPGQRNAGSPPKPAPLGREGLKGLESRRTRGWERGVGPSEDP